MNFNMIRWARITKAGSDTEQFAAQQMEYLGKVADGLIVFPYGIHANVPADSLALMFAVQGNPDNRAAIAWTPKDRPKLASGEVALYHPPTDAFIIWRKTGDLDIETGNNGTANLNIKCKDANITASGDVNVTSVTSTVTATNSIDLIATTIIEFTSPLTKVNGAFEVTAAATFGGAMTNNGKDVGDTHGHTQANDSAGDVQAAISGVT